MTISLSEETKLSTVIKGVDTDLVKGLNDLRMDMYNLYMSAVKDQNLKSIMILFPIWRPSSDRGEDAKLLLSDPPKDINATMEALLFFSANDLVTSLVITSDFSSINIIELGLWGYDDLIYENQ